MGLITTFERKKRTAFTLIELLVVISIISLISSVVLSSLSTARSKARDAKRTQDIRQVKTALAMYYLDNGQYPDVTDTAGLNNALGSFLVPKYISSLPKDPSNTGLGDYHYHSNGANTYAYGILLTFDNQTQCRSLQGLDSTSGWWSPTPLCKF